MILALPGTSDMYTSLMAATMAWVWDLMDVRKLQ
jgi:hypothetical protein